MHTLRADMSKAETTDIFNSARGGLNNANSDINYEHVLAHCNVRLTQWDQTWRQEMEKGMYIHPF